MTRIGFGLAVGLALLTILPRSAEADDGPLRPLFNGKDLTGWILPADESLFTVEDGVIVGRTRGNLKKNEFLVTDRPYGDFVLKAKVKLISGNSGIQFRSKFGPNGIVAGPQADIAEGWWGTLYEERGRGVLERHTEEARPLVKQDDWNEFVIAAVGYHVTIELNGTRIIDRTDTLIPKEGVIALQVHVRPAMEVRFKDLEISPIETQPQP